MASEFGLNRDIKILIVEDDNLLLRNLTEFLKKKCEVIGARNSREADEKISLIYGSGRRIDLAIIDINLPEGVLGTDFARRLLDLDPKIGLIHASGEFKKMASTPYQANDNLEKPITEQALFESIKKVLRQIGNKKDEKIVRFNRWQSFREVPGLSSIKLVGHKAERNETESVERITGQCMSDGNIIAFVVYNYPDFKTKVINIGVASTVGCASGCKFCLSGKERPFKRLLTKDEILGQVYHGLMNYHASEVFIPDSKTKVAVNFTCEGDAVAFNLDNCCEAIKVISRINIGQGKISTILTSIGEEHMLGRYLKHYINLPMVTHYWSLNTLDVKYREKIMPFTKKHSLENIRDLYQKIAEQTQREVTASWILIKGKTNRDQDIEALQKFLADRPFRVKVMALVDDSLAGEQIVAEADVDIFISKLTEAGVACRKRKIMGSKIFSGCGNTVVEWLTKK